MQFNFIMHQPQYFSKYNYNSVCIILLPIGEYVCINNKLHFCYVVVTNKCEGEKLVQININGRLN